MARASVVVDLSTLSHPRQLASVLFSARASGQTVYFHQGDKDALRWLAHGEALGWGYGEEASAFGDFHYQARDALDALIPNVAPLAHPAAALSLLRRAQLENWIQPRRGEDFPVLQSLLMRPSTVLWGLRDWGGSLEEFLASDIMGHAELTDGNSDLWWSLGTDAGASVRVVEAEEKWFQTPLFGVFREWLDANPGYDQVIQGGAPVDSPSGPRYLEKLLRMSLGNCLVPCMDGQSDMATTSRSTGKLLTALGDVPVPQHLPALQQVSARIEGMSESARDTDDLVRLIDNAALVGSLADIFAPVSSPSVGVYVRDSAPSLLPKPFGFVVGFVRTLVRQRRSTR
jgi:hypothetical protein